MNDLEVLRAMARSAREAVMTAFPDGGGDRIVQSGSDGNITREIDRVAESAILRCRAELDVPWGVFSEEAGWVEGDPGKTLIVDPIDGTYNAMHGIPLYSTSLGLASGPVHNITSSVVMNVPLGKSFEAVKGEGAWYNGLEIRTRPFVEERSVFNSFLGPTSLEENRLLFSWPYRGRYFGSISLEVCYVAKGAIDLFALFYRVPRITDIAGSFLILNEAGGRMLASEGREWLDYIPMLDTSEKRDFLVMGDCHQMERILEITSRLNPKFVEDEE